MAKKTKVVNETEVQPSTSTEITSIAPQSNLPVPQAPVDLAAWGVQNLTSKDIVIPKIFAMQPGSKPVVAGEAKFGEFRDSLSGSIVGDINHPIEFIPFFMEKVYVVMKHVNGAWKFFNQVPITPQNEDQEWEVEGNDGTKERWYRTMNFYCLMPAQIERNEAIPYLLSFRSSSARAGQKLTTTMFLKNLKAPGGTPASMVMELSGAKRSNEKGTFVVMDVKEKRPSSSAEISEAFSWVTTIRAGAVKVDHSDLEGEVVEGPVAVEPESTDY